MTNSNPNAATRFAPGNSGRPKGSRNKLGTQFIENLQSDFEEHGAAVIELVRRENPTAYFTTIAKLLPKELAVAMQVQHAAGPTAEEWPMMREVLAAIEAAGLVGTEPGEVFETVLRAIRADNAKLIEHAPALAPPPYRAATCAQRVLISTDDK